MVKEATDKANQEVMDAKERGGTVKARIVKLPHTGLTGITIAGARAETMQRSVTIEK